MANRHSVTVHIWQNGEGFDQAAAGKDGANVVTCGHASLKIQTPGGYKGDYFYLSFWPGNGPYITGVGCPHELSARLGPVSQRAARAIQQVEKGTPKGFGTTVWQNDYELEQKEKPQLTYRFNGMDTRQMLHFINTISTSGWNWHLMKSNCSTMVAQCLNWGGAPGFLDHPVWTPNLVRDWCESLIYEYAGSEKKQRGVVGLVTTL